LTIIPKQTKFNTSRINISVGMTVSQNLEVTSSSLCFKNGNCQNYKFL